MNELHKALYRVLQEAGLLEYGSRIEGELIREQLGIQMPRTGTKEQFDQIALRELTAVDFIRTLLLREGKYLAGDKGGYKILLPSENRAQVDAYMSQADRKLRRAQTLLRNTPSCTHKQVDQTEARIMMKRESIRERGRDIRQPATPPPSPRSIKPERDLRPPAAH